MTTTHTALTAAETTQLAQLAEAGDLAAIRQLVSTHRQPATTPAGDLAGRIRTAYRQLVRGWGDWASLLDIRAQLGDVPREQVDAALLALSRSQQINLIPQSNQKVLTPAERAAALELGGQHCHLASIQPQW